MPALGGRLASSSLSFSIKNVADFLPHLSVTSLMIRLPSFSSSSSDGAQSVCDLGEYYGANVDETRQIPLDSIPDRPLRIEKPKPTHQPQRPFRKRFDVGAAGEGKNHISNRDRPSVVSPGDGNDRDFIQRLKLLFHPEKNLKGSKGGKAGVNQAAARSPESPSPLPPLQDTDKIFRKMEQTRLVPNAVAMLDGLCKDGLFQEAMEVVSLMSEKGKMPEVVIYTAVVEGFCKANKLDDAKRIFRKMQNKGVSPNSFSFMVLIQGLYNGNRLEDSLEFCSEMLEAGHSLNLATFIGLVNAYYRERGVEEAQSVIMSLSQKGFFYDEEAIEEHLDKKGPFLPSVWRAILGKKAPRDPFEFSW